MNRAYWDTVAANYRKSVLSVFHHDTKGLIRTRIEAVADPSARAADLGCGVGFFTPILARSFGHVEACDLSDGCLSAAREHCRQHTNITYRQLDFALQPAPFEPVDLVLCVNVLIMPGLDERLRAWRMVTNQVVHNGILLLVVPSAESAAFLDFALVDLELHRGASCPEAVRRVLPRSGSARDLRQGIRLLQGQRTKHYLREELLVMLDEHQFRVSEIVRIDYPWTLLFDRVPTALPDRGLWDWLIVARRR